MASNSEHIPNFETFQRYHSGAMSLREQHLFEKQMLQDPALADAYEGFLAMQHDQIDFSAINQTLAQQLEDRIAKEEKWTFPAWTLGLAAALAIAIGMLWLALLSSPEKEKALTKAPKEIQTQTAAAPQQPEVKATPEATSAPQFAVKPSRPTQTKPSETEQIAAADEEPLLQEEMETLSLVETLNSVHTSVPAQSDESRFAYSAPPVARAAQSSGNRQDSLARKNDVIMSEAAVKRTSAAAPQSAKSQSEALSPKPLMGWVSYQLYLQQKADSVGRNGEVTVHFKVNADGTLSDFSAAGEKSLFEDAIRIVRSGPAWLPVRRNGVALAMPASVKFRFKQ